MDDLPQPWSQLAAWYDELVTAGSSPHETAVGCLLRLIPDLTGAAVLDVACGQGLATRALADGGRAGNHHRTLSTFLNALVAAGFGIAAVDEPRASARLLAQQPVYRQLPIFLGVRAAPSPSGQTS